MLYEQQWTHPVQLIPFSESFIYVLIICFNFLSFLSFNVLCFVFVRFLFNLSCTWTFDSRFPLLLWTCVFLGMSCPGLSTLVSHLHILVTLYATRITIGFYLTTWPPFLIFELVLEWKLLWLLDQTVFVFNCGCWVLDTEKLCAIPKTHLHISDDNGTRCLKQISWRQWIILQ